MKKYKLIKTYPLCPFELGAIATDENVKSDVVLSIRRGVGEYTVYPKDAIENYPEFWEEVKEKEYTILSFVNSKGDIFNIDENGEYRFKEWLPQTIGLSLESCLDGPELKIHSVRRESDGQIFTLGENITDGQSEGVIKEFEIGEHILGGMYACIGGGRETKISISLIRFLPKRKPILITEDGVEIFEGDKYWWIDSDFELTPQTAGNVGLLLPGIKSFSTKEKAEEYIKWNRPMYSLNNVTRAIFNANTDDDIIKELEKLGKK